MITNKNINKVVYHQERFYAFSDDSTYPSSDGIYAVSDDGKHWEEFPSLIDSDTENELRLFSIISTGNRLQKFYCGSARIVIDIIEDGVTNRYEHIMPDIYAWSQNFAYKLSSDGTVMLRTGYGRYTLVNGTGLTPLSGYGMEQPGVRNELDGLYYITIGRVVLKTADHDTFITVGEHEDIRIETAKFVNGRFLVKFRYESNPSTYLMGLSDDLLNIDSEATLDKVGNSVVVETVIWDGSQYVGCGFTNNFNVKALISSTDLITWTRRDISTWVGSWSTPTLYRKDNFTFVRISGYVYYSLDMLTWTYIPYTGTLVLTDFGISIIRYSQKSMHFTTDLVNWVEIHTNSVHPLGSATSVGNAVVCKTPYRIDTLLVMGSDLVWNERTIPQPSIGAYDSTTPVILPSNEGITLFGYSRRTGMNYAIHSNDLGETWDKNSTNFYKVGLDEADYNPQLDQLIVLAPGGYNEIDVTYDKLVVRKTQGVSEMWEDSLPFDVPTFNVVYGNLLVVEGVYVLAGVYFDSSADEWTFRTHYSVDFTNWETGVAIPINNDYSILTPYSNTPSTFFYHNGRNYVFACQRLLLVSPDLNTWTDSALKTEDTVNALDWGRYASADIATLSIRTLVPMSNGNIFAASVDTMTGDVTLVLSNIYNDNVTDLQIGDSSYYECFGFRDYVGILAYREDSSNCDVYTYENGVPKLVEADVLIRDHEYHAHKNIGVLLLNYDDNRITVYDYTTGAKTISTITGLNGRNIFSGVIHQNNFLILTYDYDTYTYTILRVNPYTGNIEDEAIISTGLNSNVSADNGYLFYHDETSFSIAENSLDFIRYDAPDFASNGIMSGYVNGLENAVYILYYDDNYNIKMSKSFNREDWEVLPLSFSSSYGIVMSFGENYTIIQDRGIGAANYTTDSVSFKPIKIADGLNRNGIIITSNKHINSDGVITSIACDTQTSNSVITFTMIGNGA